MSNYLEDVFKELYSGFIHAQNRKERRYYEKKLKKHTKKMLDAEQRRAERDESS